MLAELEVDPSQAYKASGVEFKVHMVAFHNPCDDDVQVRVVKVPEEELNDSQAPEVKLERVFHWGQNDFQPQACPSVSVGDIIELPSEQGETYWRVAGCGFEKITKDEKVKARVRALLGRNRR